MALRPLTDLAEEEDNLVTLADSLSLLSVFSHFQEMDSNDCVTEGNPAVFSSYICACRPRCRSSKATHSRVQMVLSNTPSFRTSKPAGLAGSAL